MQMSEAPTKTALRIPVTVSRMSCGDELVGWSGGALEIEVVAPGDGGDDAAVESLLAEILRVDRAQVRVVVGHGARRKWVEIEDYDESALERRLPGRDYGPDGEPSTSARPSDP